MFFRVAFVVVTLVVGAGMAACGRAPAAGPSGAGATSSGSAGIGAVTRVVDGDTIAVKLARARARETVRLIGIDTPESVKPNTPVQCFALEASARTKALLPPGTPVRLVRDAEARDRYGRLLAYVYRSADGLFVNLALAQEGYAVLDTIPPNVSHVDDFIGAVDEARRAGAGLWAKCGDDIPRHRAAPLPSPP